MGTPSGSVYMEKFAPSGVITRMENWCAGIEDRISELQTDISEAKVKYENLAPAVGKPFAQHQELQDAIAEHGKVQRALMKANASAAIKPEERREFEAAVAYQKQLLRSVGFTGALQQ